VVTGGGGGYVRPPCVCLCVFVRVSSVVELSEVLWHFFLQLPMLLPGIGRLRWLLVFCAWSIWAVLTVTILLLMEGLSAFLHTLRLHWSATCWMQPIATDSGVTIIFGPPPANIRYGPQSTFEPLMPVRLHCKMCQCTVYAILTVRLLHYHHIGTCTYRPVRNSKVSRQG